MVFYRYFMKTLLKVTLTIMILSCPFDAFAQNSAVDWKKQINEYKKKVESAELENRNLRRRLFDLGDLGLEIPPQESFDLRYQEKLKDLKSKKSNLEKKFKQLQKEYDQIQKTAEMGKRASTTDWAR